MHAAPAAARHAALAAPGLAPQRRSPWLGGGVRSPAACRLAACGPAAGAAALRQQQQQWSKQRQQQRQQRAGPRSLQVLASSSSGSGSTILTLPTLLTLARVAAVPALIAAWFSSAPLAAAACTALFVGASLTDYLDGYLARKMNASSAFGAFLDPVADKLMVAAVMILMCTRPLPPGLMAGNTWVMPLATCMVIGREITMSALREWAAALGPEAHSAVAVSWVGKWKTAAQMTSLALLLVGHQAAAGGAATVPPALLQVAGTAGVPLLGVAAALTLWSLADYFAALWRFF